MTAQLLGTELANLIQESKRKHSDLRQAAEKSFEELKSLRSPNEADIGPELAQKANFVNPLIIACGTKNAKFTGIAIVCLQRLIAVKALPRPRLSQVLEALREATSAGLDVQLKILQALPPLLQNYSIDVKGDLLVTALTICFILQSSKNAIVNNTSAATLLQLIVSVFDKVVTEDKNDAGAQTVGEAPSQDGPVQLKAAAMDAFRVFSDICLLTEGQRPEYLRITGLSQTFGLELIESVLTNHGNIFNSHLEQAHILRTRAMPFLINALSAKPNFATTVRLVRILYTILRRHITLLPAECGDALDILTHLLDQDTALWKRSLCMEIFRGIFAEAGLLRRIYLLYDAQEGGKSILRNLTATFVRVSTEKPSVIGLGHQSTLPVNAYNGSSSDQALLEASGVSGIISSSGQSEGPATGISTQWSSMRVPCIDQLDKSEPPAIPDSYVYSLTLACITSLSEGLAKFILPLTVPGGRGKRPSKQEGGRDSPVSSLITQERENSVATKGGLERSSSFKKNPVPVNPLLLDSNHPMHAEVKACAGIIDDCWPAILATCSTFLYAALDTEYYHGLVRAFQKFTHVAGLLQLATPRDAFLTTLGKAAVPPNVFTACMNSGARPSTPTAGEAPNNIFGNARGLLSVDSLVSQGSSATTEKQKPQASMDASFSASLNTRNLLCLRALLNLGIALGPTLGSSWQIILETLQQADLVLFASGKTAGRMPAATRGSDAQAENEAASLLVNFNTEIKAVETAASRLFESTIDFPNAAFVEVVTAICNLLETQIEPTSPIFSKPESPKLPRASLRTPTTTHKRNMSTSAGAVSGPHQQDQFALAKLGDVASINLERLLTYPPDVSGWDPLVNELISTLSSTTANAPVRLRAADILVRLVLEAASAVPSLPEGSRPALQLRLLSAFRDGLAPLQIADRHISLSSHATDIDIHRVVLDGLKGLLENCGESLVSGWDVAFAIINTIFIERAADSENIPESENPSSLVTRSQRLVKPSFASLQLICSDFLSSLPTSCFLHLVDTLYKFCSQDDDLNIALTTVTFFWAISDFLSGRSKSLAVSDAMVDLANDAALMEVASNPSHPGSGAALWMLLLLRLTSVTTDSRLELRNSAIQTLLRIISAYGSSLNSDAWSVCIKSVIFTLLSSIEERLRKAQEAASGGVPKKEWNETAVVILNGVSELLAGYMDVLTSHPRFLSLWQELLGHLQTLIDFQSLEINKAAFYSLGSILSKCETGTNRSLNSEAVDMAWNVWSRGLPIPSQDKDGQAIEDNQKCLLSWADSLTEVYRLMEKELTLERVQRLSSLLREAVLQATPDTYTSDIEYATPLQSRVLHIFKMVRTDVSGVSTVVIKQVAEFISLAFDKTDQSPAQKRTFVAMSKDCMPILHYHLTQHASDLEIFTGGALSTTLSALAKPIVLKYQFPIMTKSIQPWREATKASLSILESTLPHLGQDGIGRGEFQDVWHAIVTISNGVISADYESVLTKTDVADDQQFDIDSVRKLRELIIPSLGADTISDKTRKAYAEGLFRTSIIHAPAPAESSLIYGTSDTDSVSRGLSDLYKPRTGRTIDPAPTPREKMAYVCLDELFALVAAYDDDNSAPQIVVQPPTPRVNRTMTLASSPTKGDGEDDLSRGKETIHALHTRLARTAAPYLILRCALSLRAYIADHPLRGLMPQPLSQRRELAKIVRCLVDLKSEPDAIPDTPNVESEARKHLLRLYPLLVKAVGVAGRSGDEGVLRLVEEGLGVVGGELGVV